MSLLDRSIRVFVEAQNSFIEGLLKVDPKVELLEDSWQREDQFSSDLHAGGGVTKVIRNGKIFEKGGVNFSHVRGILPASMCQRLLNIAEDLPFEACGTSVVIHPFSPIHPTVHFNCRFLTVASKSWFGGGGDLTPYVFNPEEAVRFHQGLKNVCDEFSTDYYPKYKEECDRYFYIPHRKEARGVGGIFFDYLGQNSAAGELESHLRFVTRLCQAFPKIYLDLIEDKKGEDFTDKQKQFQLWRRGRYVEFNLMYDRGTRFGLESNGRVESILMSLPAEVRWEYNWQPDAGSDEEKLIEVLKNPRDWLQIL